MDTEQKLINAVKAILDVLDEIASEHALSEHAHQSLKRAKREMRGAQSKSDEEAGM